MSAITYTNKDKNGVNPVNQWRDVDANEVKTAVNSKWDSLIPTAVKSGAYNAVVNDLVPVNAAANNVTITLPTAPANASMIAVKVIAITEGTFTVTIATGGTDVFNLAGGATTSVLNLLFSALIVQYNASTGIWYSISHSNNLDRLDARFEKLVNKDATGGYAGLTLFKINFKNAANTFLSFFTNTNTAARTYTFQDRDGTVADTWVNKVKGATNNRYISGNEIAGTLVTHVFSANFLRAYAMEIRFPMTFDRIALEITTGTSGKQRFGIYADDGTGYPGALVVDSGEFTISAPAVLSSNINVTVLPGLYWLAWLTDTGNQARGHASTSLQATGGFPSTIAANATCMWSVALSYAALPNPFTAAAAQAVTNVPIIAMRIA